MTQRGLVAPARLEEKGIGKRDRLFFRIFLLLRFAARRVLAGVPGEKINRHRLGLDCRHVERHLVQHSHGGFLAVLQRGRTLGGPGGRIGVGLWKRSRTSLIASGADSRAAVVRLSPSFVVPGGWSDVAGWDLHPLKIAAFPGRTERSGLMGLENTTERDSIARLP